MVFFRIDYNHKYLKCEDDAVESPLGDSNSLFWKFFLEKSLIHLNICFPPLPVISFLNSMLSGVEAAKHGCLHLPPISKDMPAVKLTIPITLSGFSSWYAEYGFPSRKPEGGKVQIAGTRI